MQKWAIPLGVGFLLFVIHVAFFWNLYFPDPLNPYSLGGDFYREYYPDAHYTLSELKAGRFPCGIPIRAAAPLSWPIWKTPYFIPLPPSWYFLLLRTICLIWHWKDNSFSTTSSPAFLCTSSCVRSPSPGQVP